MRKFILIFLLSLFLIEVFDQEVFSATDTILMVIANRGFRDEEFFTPYELFKKEGFKVAVASDKKKRATGMLGGSFLPDLTIRDINDIRNFVAVVLPGGIGSTVFWNDLHLREIIRNAYSSGKIIGALCLSPVTLVKAGILEGKKATVWYSEADYLRSKGVAYIDSDVVVDGNIVTASGPKAAEKFASEIIKLLRRKK